MTKDVTFTCPQCGKVWIEQQDEDDDWFGLATNQTLCQECGRKAVKEIVDKWNNDSRAWNQEGGGLYD